MLYVIHTEDFLHSLEKRLSENFAYLNRLQLLRDEGRLLIAGLFPVIDSDDPGITGFTGSMVIAKFESLESAKAWAKEDPYVGVGVYRKISIKPYKKIL